MRRPLPLLRPALPGLARIEPSSALGSSRDDRVTYAECLARSEDIARGLHARGIERFACQLARAADVLAVLCGSSAVAAEACVYPGYLDGDGINDLAAAFDHEIIVTAGLAYFAINIAMVALAEWVAPNFSIDGFWTYVGVVVVVWAVNWIGREVVDRIEEGTRRPRMLRI